MSAHFKVKSKINLDDLNVGDRVECSDFAQITQKGNFVQLEYISTDDTSNYEVKPGIWTIRKTMAGMELIPTSFVHDNILTSFINTKDITDKVDCFFRNLHVYKEYGIEVPKRAMLIYGPAGSGKTTKINEIASTYAKDEKTAVIVWATDKFESYEVKDFIKTFKYTNVEKIILVVEDLGGVELDQVRMKSDASLLSLLDNQEKTFKLPILILATTNFPENFLGNLMNRPQRFDDKISVPLPDSDARSKLLSFFSKDKADEECLNLVKGKKGEDLSPAHLKEAVIRSAIYEKPLKDVIVEIFKEIDIFKKNFDEKKKNIGMFSDD